MNTVPPRRLVRSRDDRMIAGVCGGIAEYLGVDPTVVRLLAVASIFLPGPQFIAYLVAWLVIPDADRAAHPAARVPPAPAAPPAPAPAAASSPDAPSSQRAPADPAATTRVEQR